MTTQYSCERCGADLTFQVTMGDLGSYKPQCPKCQAKLDPAAVRSAQDAAAIEVWFAVGGGLGALVGFGLHHQLRWVGMAWLVGLSIFALVGFVVPVLLENRKERRRQRVLNPPEEGIGDPQVDGQLKILADLRDKGHIGRAEWRARREEILAEAEGDPPAE